MVQMLNVPATWVHLNKTKINSPKKKQKTKSFQLFTFGFNCDGSSQVNSQIKQTVQRISNKTFVCQMINYIFGCGSCFFLPIDILHCPPFLTIKLLSFFTGLHLSDKSRHYIEFGWFAISSVRLRCHWIHNSGRNVRIIVDNGKQKKKPK